MSTLGPRASLAYALFAIATACFVLFGAALSIASESFFERFSRSMLLGSLGLAVLLAGFEMLFNALARLGYQPKGPLRSLFTPGLPKSLRKAMPWCAAVIFISFVLALLAHG